MSHEKMRVVHELIREERYREARGILESEPDIDPRTAQKWLKWLDELHHEERLQAGVLSDKHKKNADHKFREAVRLTFGMIGVILVSFPVWQLVRYVFTYETASVVNGIVFFLAALVLGFIGWQKTAHIITPQRSIWVGGAVWLLLMIYVISSGIPFLYYYEPAITYLLAGFALIFPALAFACWHTGGKLGLLIARAWRG